MTSLRECIQASDELASINRRGRIYNRLREHLMLAEGACRQLAVFRQDARWYPIGRMLADVHDKAGDWLRGYKEKGTNRRIHFALGEKNRLFLMLSANLKALYKGVELLRDSKTGVSGMILPKTPVLGRRTGAPVRGFKIANTEKVTGGGIIVPRAIV